jgi:hypothetical protein
MKKKFIESDDHFPTMSEKDKEVVNKGYNVIKNLVARQFFNLFEMSIIFTKLPEDLIKLAMQGDKSLTIEDLIRNLKHNSYEGYNTLIPTYKDNIKYVEFLINDGKFYGKETEFYHYDKYRPTKKDMEDIKKNIHDIVDINEPMDSATARKIFFKLTEEDFITEIKKDSKLTVRQIVDTFYNNEKIKDKYDLFLWFIKTDLRDREEKEKAARKPKYTQEQIDLFLEIFPVAMENDIVLSKAGEKDVRKKLENVFI